MGQYQLWLQYREIDQQLHTQLESLEGDLAHLQEQARQLAVAHPASDNLILQALTHYLKPPSTTDIPVSNGTPTERSETVSSALFAWSNLPNFDTGKIRGANFRSPVTPMPPHSEFDLLPSDMHTFFRAHSQTAPQVKLPWWLRNNTLVPQQQSSDPVEQRPIAPIDQQSLRTNQLVQRWLERWRKRGDTPGSDEVQRSRTQSPKSDGLV